MFKQIVTGTNGTARAREAVAVAAEMAATHGAQLHLVRAFRGASAVAGAMVAAEVMSTALMVDRDIEREVGHDLDNLAAELRERGIDVKTHSICSTAVDALLKVAEAESADLIVVGDKGMHGPHRVLGSIPNSVAHHASCAVMIVPTAS